MGRPKKPKTDENKLENTSKKRGRPAGSKTKKITVKNEPTKEDLIIYDDAQPMKKMIDSEDYDNLVLEQLKNKRKATEKEAFKEEYETGEEEEEEEEDPLEVEGYDIETLEGVEYEEPDIVVPKKNKRKRRKSYYEEFGIENDYYESDYNISDFEDYD